MCGDLEYACIRRNGCRFSREGMEMLEFILGNDMGEFESLQITSNMLLYWIPE